MCFSTLKEYLQRTETLRVTGSQLLISFQKPHKAVSRDTISRIRTVMQMSGINLSIKFNLVTRLKASKQNR